MVLRKGQVFQFAAEMVKKTAKSEIVNRFLVTVHCSRYKKNVKAHKEIPIHFQIKALGMNRGLLFFCFI